MGLISLLEYFLFLYFTSSSWIQLLTETLFLWKTRLVKTLKINDLQHIRNLKGGMLQMISKTLKNPEGGNSFCQAAWLKHHQMLGIPEQAGFKTCPSWPLCWWQQQYHLSKCNWVMNRFDWGFPWDPIYKVVGFGCPFNKRVSPTTRDNHYQHL